MGAFKVETCYGDVMVRNVYDYDTGESYYEVYEPTTDDECGYGKYIGEFNTPYDYNSDDVEERQWFVDKLEEMLDDNDYIGIQKAPQQKRDIVYKKLENLVHKRFNKESLEKELSNIFNGEEIHIELGCEDVDYLTDWDYMFSSEQDEIGGDFDIYVLFHKDKRAGFDDATFMVTEIACDFFIDIYKVIEEPQMVSLEKVCEWLKAKDDMTMGELSMILGTNFIENFKKEIIDVK